MRGSCDTPSGAPSRAVAARPGARAADLAAALRATPGTVTGFLERLAGERVDADVVAQEASGAPAGNPFGLPSGSRLLHRAVLLRGRATGRPYVYACSVIAAGRLPAPAVRSLETGIDPIGRVLADHGLATAREEVGDAAGPPHDGGRLLASSGAAVLSRRYHLVVEGALAADISEWYLATLLAVLAGRAGGTGGTGGAVPGTGSEGPPPVTPAR